MAFFNLLVVDQNRLLSTPASDRALALAIFEYELGVQLTLDEPSEGATRYLLDEWEVGPHWVNPTIPVFVAPTN
jgi:hypothetical protein